MTTPTFEYFQKLIARLLATSPAGHGLRIIGGFRYRFLAGSCRTSVDLDYHWDGDLDAKQEEVLSLLKRKLAPEVRLKCGYKATVRAAAGPDAESPFVRIVETAFYPQAGGGARIEVPVEITRVPCNDPPVASTVDGTVYLTLSDADMIESKILALLGRTFVAQRDLVDVFLFQSALLPDSARRLAQKLAGLRLDREAVSAGVRKLQANRAHHARAIEAILDEQVEAASAANIRAAGGAEMIFDAVLAVLRRELRLTEDPRP